MAADYETEFNWHTLSPFLLSLLALVPISWIAIPAILIFGRPWMRDLILPILVISACWGAIAFIYHDWVAIAAATVAIFATPSIRDAIYRKGDKGKPLPLAYESRLPPPDDAP